jgi:hypothetical protein
MNTLLKQGLSAILSGRDAGPSRPFEFGLSPRACTVCGRNTINQRRLEIFESERRSWRKRTRPLCSRCAPRLALAARHGGVLHTAKRGLIADFAAELNSQSHGATHPESSDGVGWVPLNPVVAAVCLMSVFVVMAFGTLATFGSPLFFLSVVIPFVPLVLVAYRSTESSVLHERCGAVSWARLTQRLIPRLLREAKKGTRS